MNYRLMKAELVLLSTSCCVVPCIERRFVHEEVKLNEVGIVNGATMC